MNKPNWDTYLFHCSMIGSLMTQPKTKADREAGELSATTKSLLKEIFIAEVFGRVNYDSANKYTEKGLLVEQDSLDIVTRIYNRGFLAKNRDTLHNKYVCGTPDVVKPVLIDIKSSWSIWTFAKVDFKLAYDTYYWQLWNYMWLLRRNRSLLAYALCNTPDEQREKELYNLTFKRLTPEEILNAEKNYIFDDIDEKMRVKIFKFTFEPERKAELIRNVLLWRKYLKSIKL
jgi:hypothetical protein